MKGNCLTAGIFVLILGIVPGATGRYALTLSSVTKSIPVVVTDAILSPSRTVSELASTMAWENLDKPGVSYNKVATLQVPVTSTQFIDSLPTAEAADLVFVQQQASVQRGTGSRLPARRHTPLYTPQNNTELLIGETYLITWDSTWFEREMGGVTYVMIRGQRLPIDDEDVSTTIFVTENIEAKQGFWYLKIDESYARNLTEGYLTLDITASIGNSANVRGGVDNEYGLTLRVVNSTSNATPSNGRRPLDLIVSQAVSTNDGSRLTKSDKLVIGIVIPVVCLFVTGVLVYMILLRKMGSNVRGIFGARGYGIRSSYSQRTRRSKSTHVELANVSHS
ncbi:hypothetical protein V1512DRAFT_250415 [Lipomyces arxii]|uniref:uncharacterized protein n=1 Tax=Lipomyces arxii TaxID=56418 RepID=UPI0034CFBD90